MKWLLCLLIGMLIASPAMAQVTRAEVEQIAAASDARILAKLEKISEELVTVKTEIAVIKTDIAASKEQTATEIRGLTRQLSFVQFLLGILVTGLLTVLLAFLKNQWDKRKAGDEKLGAQQKELTEQQKVLAEKQSEIDALRAENERMKNTSGLVSPTGGRLEDEVKGGSS